MLCEHLMCIWILQRHIFSKRFFFFLLLLYFRNFSLNARCVSVFAVVPAYLYSLWFHLIGWTNLYRLAVADTLHVFARPLLPSVVIWQFWKALSLNFAFARTLLRTRSEKALCDLWRHSQSCWQLMHGHKQKGMMLRSVFKCKSQERAFTCL